MRSCCHKTYPFSTYNVQYFSRPSFPSTAMSRLPQPENNPLPDLIDPPVDTKVDPDAKEHDEGDIYPVSDIPVTAPVLDNEPIVTRKELWSYYCKFYYPSARPCC
jgi:hypothetical protein